ncbi:MAG: thioesterase [Desulfobacteraceae bacterium 4572_19]|nr:MAG: thioesterase [Desulfobacteraceae bacterium 4572_19]
MIKSYEVKIKVPFHDLDPVHIVWHGNYFKYFDIARFGLFNDVGIDLYQYSMTNQYIFPITKSSIKYIRPLRHNDEFICKATVTDAKYKIAMEFEIYLANGNILCAKGKSEQLAVKLINSLSYIGQLLYDKLFMRI